MPKLLVMNTYNIIVLALKYGLMQESVQKKKNSCSNLFPLLLLELYHCTFRVCLSSLALQDVTVATAAFWDTKFLLVTIFL